jgi:TRAP-type C4-dicarboxylate transport system substrate-binding protein
MNKDKWNSLPQDLQNTIEKINQEWTEKQGKQWDEIDAVGREYGLERGTKIITLSKEEEERWSKAVKPIFDNYIKYTKEKGLPGEEAVNFCMDYLKSYQKK